MYGGSSYTSSSSIGRVGNSLCAAIIGLLLFLGSFLVLVYNEGSAVQTFKSLEEGLLLVTPTTAEYSAYNENRLVHLAGAINELPTVTDDEFGVTLPALKLNREVERYQWVERTRQVSHKDAFGNKETRTDYYYDLEWSSKSSDRPFYNQQYSNPPWLYFSAEYCAGFAIGSFRFPKGMVMNQVTAKTAVQLLEGPPSSAIATSTPGTAVATVKSSRRDVVPMSRHLFVGNNPRQPVHGDYRISYRTAAPTHLSIVGMQSGKSMRPFPTEAGDDIFLVQEGVWSAKQMFEAAAGEAETRTWIIRLVGFGMMFVGLMMIASPATAVLEVIPLLGGFLSSVLGIGILLGSLLLAGGLSALVIAVSWVWYRPWLLALVIGAIGGGWWLWNKKQEEARAQRVQ